jgi:uncharacterized protein (DUF58 family)
MADANPETTLRPRIDDLLELRHQAHTLGLASHHLVNSNFSGLYASIFRGAGLNFEEVRAYREGDDIRNMDWKVTARTNLPHLKIFREERERSVIFCVDNGPHMNFGTRGTFKSIQAARATALLGWAANRQQDRVGGMLFGDPANPLQYFRPSRGRRALWRLLRSMTEPSQSGRSDAAALVTALRRAERASGTGSVLFVIADFNHELSGLERMLGSLSQSHAVVLLPVDDPADREIPAMGPMVFYGPDGELVEIDTNDLVARQSYAEAWEERRSLLLALVTRLNLIVLPIRTDEDIHVTLLRDLRRYASGRVM